MQTRFGVARTVTRAESLDDFQEAVSSYFVPLEVDSDVGDPFVATLSAAGADEVIFTEVKSAPLLVRRTPDLIERGGSGFYKVSLLLAGSSTVIQDGREVVMHPGDLVYYDTSRPYSLLFDEKFRSLVMMFPKARLEFPRDPHGHPHRGLTR